MIRTRFTMRWRQSAECAPRFGNFSSFGPSVAHAFNGWPIVTSAGNGVDAGTALRASRLGASHASDRPGLSLLGLDEAGAPAAEQATRAIAAWVRGYLMRPHPDLGRPGHVCPFTAQAARLALVRIGVSRLGGDDPKAVLNVMRAAMQAFDRLPCKRSTRIFRTVIVAFPNCADESGIATLRATRNAMRYHSVLRGKMIGLFEPRSEAEGLLNRNFRPLRAPVPALAIRMLVAQDAPFVLRNPLLVRIYVLKFLLAGVRRLFRALVPRSVSPLRPAAPGKG